MKYAQVIKTSQTLHASPDGVMRVQYLEVRRSGTLKLSDGTNILITQRDIGRTIKREVNVETKIDRIEFL